MGLDAKFAKGTKDRVTTNLQRLWDRDSEMAEKCTAKMELLEQIEESTHKAMPLRSSMNYQCPVCGHALTKSNAVVLNLGGDKNNKLVVSREAISTILLSGKSTFKRQVGVWGKENITITRDQVLNADFEPLSNNTKGAMAYSFSRLFPL